MFDIHNNLLQSDNFSDTYIGHLHEKGKIKKEWHKEPPQTYVGEVLHGNIHRHGFYFVESDKKLFYDGLFYANKLEGYAQIFYNDGSNFQGLFKHNLRFGPGIFTYPNGEQDVGLWGGRNLLRLGGLNEKNLMPRLAVTPSGLLKLLKFRYHAGQLKVTSSMVHSFLALFDLHGARKGQNMQVVTKLTTIVRTNQVIELVTFTFIRRYLVPVCLNHEDVAYTILEKLGANESVLKESYKLYNLEVDNRRNIFFNKKLFDKHFYNDQDCTIEIILNDSEEEDTKDEDTEQEESNEETPGGRLDINTERVREISEALEVIESRLQDVKKQKVVVEKRVEYCRACCSREMNEENLTPHGKEECNVETGVATATDVFSSARALLNKGSSPPLSFKGFTFPIKISAPKMQLPRKGSPAGDSLDLSNWASDVELPANKVSSEEDSLDLDVFNDFSMRSETADVVSQIQGYLIDTCRCDESGPIGDLFQMEKELEAITKDVLFFECIKKNLKHKLETHLQNCQEKNNVKTRKVLVNDVLAWNNEAYCMRMLKHSFLHRRSEYMVNFKVSDLLSGNRTQFGNPGRHEKNCIEFLAACSNGDLEAIFKHVGKNDVCVNVCDAKGNNGVFFAAIKRHTEVIKTLMSLGAKVNQQNDEGLFPLSMCILADIAERQHVDDWEKSFLPDVEPMMEQKEAYKWYPTTSLLNMLEQEKFITKEMGQKYSNSKQTSERKPYLFDTVCVTPTEEEIAKFKEEELNIRRTKSKVTIQQVKSIKESIKTLLECGANPNVCEAPLPPLFLSVFTEDLVLVEYILIATSDINITIKHDLTCLHIITSLPCCQSNVDICTLLFAYNIDPKMKTTTDHWPEQKAHILGKNVNPDEVKDLGKNALHMLCMRRDFPIDTCSYFQQMATLFGDSDIDYSAKYLGHTPLSLAVLFGNQKLVETIIKLHSINPHEVLDNNMGNVLTIYILKRYEDVIPSGAKDILNCLVELGANPLKPIGEFDNAIEFMEKEHQVSKDKKKKKSLTEQKQSSKTAEKNKGITQKALKDYLKELGRETVTKYIQMQVVENLYNLIEDNMMEHECVPILAELLNPFRIISNLQNLFRYVKIKSERYDKEICVQLMDLAKMHHKEIKPKKEAKKPAKGVKKELQTDSQIETYDFGIILDVTDFKRMKKTDINCNLLPPGIDNPSIYKVCFHCLKKHNKMLLVCPRCQLVYFCSDSCNKANLKLHTFHTCNIDFYVTETEKLESESPDNTDRQENLSELYGRVRESCEKRWLKKRTEKMELERKRLQEEMKLDIYGTKFSRRLKQVRRMVRTPTMISLLGSVTDLAGMEIEEYECLVRRHLNDSDANKTLTLSMKSDTTGRKLKRTSSDEKYKCMVTKKHVSSLMRLTTEHNKKKPCEVDTCECKECLVEDQPIGKVKYRCVLENKEKNIREKIGMKKETDLLSETTVKKLRKIPSRYQEFIELLTKYFPEVDFSSLFLPYACYSNGHLYYKFLENDFYTRTYSMM